MQAYSPFRTVLLEREELSRLGKLRPMVPVCHTLFHWAVIVAAWAAVAVMLSPWVVALAVPVIGVNFYGLYIIGHDGLHRRLFEAQGANDAWNDLLILGSFGAITRLNRTNHMDHHQDTCLESDPDRHKYLHAGKDAAFPFVVFLSGLASLLPSVRNVFLGGKAQKARKPYCIRDVMILVLWQAGLIGGLSWAIGWWAYPLLWVLPVYFFGYRADLTRVFCEHSVIGTDAEADRNLRLITYRSNGLERLFFAPHNMNFHAAHHLWPGIPYYNLPEADRLMRARAANDPRLMVRSSYAGYLLDYLRWRVENRIQRPGREIMVLPPSYPVEPIIAACAVPSCPICCQAGGVRIAQGHDYEMETCANPWPVSKCPDCGAFWLDPRPDISTLPVIYPSNYYSYAMSQTLSPLVLWGKSVLDRIKFAGILRDRAPKSYLDIGCGDGHYLELMAARGVPKEKILGMELGASQALRARGFTIFDRRVEECDTIMPASLDLVTMFHVIEHVADPVLVLRRIRDWLSSDGVLALETPNTDSLDARLFRTRWWGGYHFPRHWVLFDAKSIRVALEKAGLEITDIRYQTGHSFWLYSFHHALRYNARLPMPRLARLFDPLRSKVTLILFTGMDIVRRTLGMKTSAMLILARRKR